MGDPSDLIFWIRNLSAPCQPVEGAGQDSAEEAS